MYKKFHTIRTLKSVQSVHFLMKNLYVLEKSLYTQYKKNYFEKKKTFLWDTIFGITSRRNTFGTYTRKDD